MLFPRPIELEGGGFGCIVLRKFVRYPACDVFGGASAPDVAELSE